MKNLFTKILIFLIVLTVCPFANGLFAQNRIETGYPFINNYTSKEYHADTQNWAIVQNEKGIIYFGNNTGLLEFDGADWRLYPMSHNSTIRTLAIDSSGIIFAGGIGELGYFSPDSLGKLTFRSLLPYVPKDHRDFSDVWQVLIGNGNVYFNVDKYILIWDVQKEEFKTIQGNDNFHLIFLVNGALYAREWGKGLQILQGDSLRLVKGGELFANKRIYVMLPFPGESGTSLIVTRTMGMFKYDGTHFIPFKTEADAYLKENLIYLPGLILDDGNILLGTLNDGAVIIDRFGKVKQKFTRKSGILSPVVYYPLQDHSGAIWLATDMGISRIDYASQVSYFDSRNNFSTSAQQLIRHNGILYAATNNGVYYLEPKTLDFHQIKNSNNQTVAFLQFGDDLLVGTLDGLFKIENYLLKPVRLSVGSEYDVNVLQQSKSDPHRVFVGAVGVWSIYKTKNAWEDEGRILEIEDIANSIVEDTDGTLWVGSNTSGLFKISFQKDDQGKTTLVNPVIEKFYAESGLPKGGISVKKINNENYFLSGDNFYRYDKTKHKFYLDNTLKVVSSLPNYLSPNSIAEDKARRLWISMGREPALGTPKPGGTYQWLKAPFERFSNEIIVSIYPENNSVVWFSTSSSIIKYDLTKSNEYTYDYPVLIRKVDIQSDSTIYFGGRVKNSKIPQIDFDDRTIRFTFAATSFEDETANQFKTFLEGYDENWSAWVRKNEKEYTNLSPGKYTFNVMTKNVFEIESKKASYSFEILPPWYRTWVAYFFYVFILAGLIFVVDRFQRRRLLVKEKEKMKIHEAEHRAEVAELQARVVQAENERKSKELEEARQLQLSMLPKEFPRVPGLKIAAHMQTATEVGGDYYDFHLAKDGTLTAVIGDATGHGLKAGTMVTITKSLFNSLAANEDILDTFRRISGVIRGMSFRRLSMCLMMLKLKGNKLSVASAAMPPALIYRRKANTVEEIFSGGMPLGTMTNFPYSLQENFLENGDTLLMLSDGLPELKNERDEMFGYNRMKSTLRAVGKEKPEKIIDHFKNTAAGWAGANVPDDDITFLVIRKTGLRPGAQV